MNFRSIDEFKQWRDRRDEQRRIEAGMDALKRQSEHPKPPVIVYRTPTWIILPVMLMVMGWGLVLYLVWNPSYIEKPFYVTTIPGSTAVITNAGHLIDWQERYTAEHTDNVNGWRLAKERGREIKKLQEELNENKVDREVN